MANSFTTQAIILKRSNIGETDRLVTLLSQDVGKITCIAKGVRKLQSSTRACLEPGNMAKVFLIRSHALPLLTQAQLVQDASPLRQNLLGIRRLSEILEIFDRLFVEDYVESDSFSLAEKIYHELLQPNKNNGVIKHYLDQLLQNLGYQSLAEAGFQSITDYVAMLTEKKMKSFAYLDLHPNLPS